MDSQQEKLLGSRNAELEKELAQKKRDLEIEAALEKVRSRSLAMHKTNELQEVVNVVFENLLAMGIEADSVNISIPNEKTREQKMWIAVNGVPYPNSIILPDHDDPISVDGWKAWDSGQDLFCKAYTFDEKNKFFSWAFEHTDLKYMPAERKNWVLQREGYAYSLAIGKISVIQALNYSGKSLDTQQNDILKRFAKVFEQAYIRFLDLEKAEALAIQAQENLIQLQTEKRRAEDALTELQAAQKQLIQSEKMASLGELTAGIAHEIQNPLNFINNFADVNTELLIELQDLLKDGNIDEALTISDDIRQNEEKINHHGKRADSIVKGMLQHSRASSNLKELTNINKLVDEYLRLSYHGLRAKNKTFNAEMVTRFNDTLPELNAVQQDIGRVMLNLFNNAFYAVEQKQKTAGKDYRPTVEVSTSIQKGFVEIKVTDNGIGIPDALKDKIMQPFFTTKPTGEGTGLGLSLTYDMVVKGHGGNINVESKEGEYTEFTVSLPLS